MAVTLLTKVQVILGVTEMTWLVIIASIIMHKIWFDYRYRFLLVLCVLIIVSDISTALLAVSTGLENTKIRDNK